MLPAKSLSAPARTVVAQSGRTATRQRGQDCATCAHFSINTVGYAADPNVRKVENTTIAYLKTFRLPTGRRLGAVSAAPAAELAGSS